MSKTDLASEPRLQSPHSAAPCFTADPPGERDRTFARSQRYPVTCRSMRGKALMRRFATFKPHTPVVPLVGTLALVLAPWFIGSAGSVSARDAPSLVIAQKGDGGGRGGGGGGRGGGGSSAGGAATEGGGPAVGKGGGGRATNPGGNVGRAVRGDSGERATEARRGDGPRVIRRGGRDGRGGDGARGDRRRSDGVSRGRGDGRPWRRGTRYLWGPGITFYFYDGWYYGDCSWLRRRAEATGSAYWWRRYRRCRSAW